MFCYFRFAQAYPDGAHYFVLLIITDGVITDMPQTIDSIIAVRHETPIFFVFNNFLFNNVCCCLTTVVVVYCTFMHNNLPVRKGQVCLPLESVGLTYYGVC